MNMDAFWPIFWSIIGTIGTGLASHAEGVETKIGSYSPAANQGADQSGGGGGGGGGDTPAEINSGTGTTSFWL